MQLDLSRRRASPPSQLGGFFDFDSIFGSVGSLFTGIGSGLGSLLPGGSNSPITLPPGGGVKLPANDFQYFLQSVGTYLQNRDLAKLNRDLVQRGLDPVTQQTADYYANQQRNSGIPTWLPWVAVAGLAFMLFQKK